MNRYFVFTVSKIQKVKPKTNFLFGLVCFFILVLGGLLVPSAAEVFQEGDKVVAQNILPGPPVHKDKPNSGDINRIPNGTRGTILDLREAEGKIWYEVDWENEDDGWIQAEADGCNAIGSAALADRRDKIVTLLFLDIPHQETHHEYNGYGCNLTWRKNGELVYTGGHSGWDVQTKDKSTHRFFYSLTAGEVIADGKDNSNTIAVYDSVADMTTLYLHASDVLVSMGNKVEIGEKQKPLGRQGKTGNADGPHVHIEVRVGKHADPSAGAGDGLNPTVDPVPYLYRWVAGHLRTRFLPSDVNHDGDVDIYDWLRVLISLLRDDQYNPQYDVNSDGIVSKKDLDEVREHLGDPPPSAPAISTHTRFDEVTVREGRIAIGDVVVSRKIVQQLLDIARKEDNGTIAFKHGIAKLESLLATMIPEKTILLANYPNPFNPETWIPYHLASDTDVTVTIYDATGGVVRRLPAGYQRSGYYTSQKRAIYWDGRTETGERVASGIYFYTFTTSDVTATRKMVILK